MPASEKSCAGILLGAFVAGAGTAWAMNTPQYVVSQAGRAFKPTEIVIKRGETVQIFNDDGDLTHHVYIESDQMRFDSGDMKPGSRTNIAFPVVGDFSALCAIHPKMKLVVRVK